MRCFMLGLLLLTMLLAGCSKKQTIIFEAKSISWRGAESSVEQECRDASQAVQKYLDDGWKIVAASPKELVVFRGMGKCSGTEYVLEK
jgi:hypothetical protein